MNADLAGRLIFLEEIQTLLRDIEERAVRQGWSTELAGYLQRALIVRDRVALEVLQQQTAGATREA